jgi:uncharacterized membrane protein YidH (DUF202 family)
MSIRLYDSGLQPERTLLAWRRTCLALGLSTAVGIRYAAEGDPVGAVSIGIPALVVVIAAYAMTAMRYRNVTVTLTSGTPHLASGGRAITMLSLVALGVAVEALHFVVAHAGN